MYCVLSAVGLLGLYVVVRRYFAPRRPSSRSFEERLHELRMRGVVKYSGRGGDPYALPATKPIVDEAGRVWDGARWIDFNDDSMAEEESWGYPPGEEAGSFPMEQQQPPPPRPR